MSGYIASPQAVNDIFEIWRYVAEHGSVDTANRVEDEIYACFLIAGAHARART